MIGLFGIVERGDGTMEPLAAFNATSEPMKVGKFFADRLTPVRMNTFFAKSASSSPKKMRHGATSIGGADRGWGLGAGGRGCPLRRGRLRRGLAIARSVICAAEAD
jgi:hypothetical protein